MKRRPPTSRAAVALEISPQTAKLMAATTAPFRIEQLNASTLAEAVEDPVAALRALLEGHPLGTRRVGLLFGRGAFSLRTLELPSVNSKELASMLELQLGKLTPYPRAEILSGWATIGSFREGYTSVLLAIARKGLIEGVLGVLKTKGVQPEWIGVSAEGLEAWWAKNLPAEPSAPSQELTALIDVDGASTDGAILSNDRLLFSHSIAIGHEQLKTSDQAALRWIGELVRLPRILLHEDIKGRIGRGVMTGVTQGLETLVEQLASQWGVTVETKDALAAFVPSPSVQSAAQASRASFAALAGVLASGAPPRIDLMPQETRVSQALQVRSKHLARLAASLTAIVVFGAILYGERILVLRHYLGQLNARLAEVEQTSAQVMAQREQMRRIGEWLRPSRSVLEVLHAVASTTDAEVAISQLSYRGAEPVTLRGTAQSMPAAFAFLDRLKAQGACVNVQARSVAKARGLDAVGAEFELACELRGS